MNKFKKKIIIWEFVALTLVLFVGVTYSLYTSNANLESDEIPIANFVFNSNKTNVIEIPFNDLIPGDNVPYTFEVTNNFDGKSSDVTLEYQIKIKTLGVMPLTFELTKLDVIDEVVFSCDNTTARNDEGILECVSPVMQMDYNKALLDKYRLNVIFPSIYSDAMYANLLDYVDIEIDSWQKIE